MLTASIPHAAPMEEGSWPGGSFKRDYVAGAELRDAETVLAQLGAWIDDYNTQAAPLGARDAEPG